MLRNKLITFLVACCLTAASAFTTHQRSDLSYSSLASSTAAADDLLEATEKGLLRRDRYVATNRFSVRQNQAAKFEKRWATRKSRLATLQGFKYFHLMRRVKIDEETGEANYDEGTDDESAQGNYVSFTIWDKKSDFSAWRTGDAFKEAHGGTSIGAFMSTMISSAMVLKGAPKPAFYDGLLQQSVKPEAVAEIVDGWRSVEADGINTLPTECFVACNQFFVPPENAPAFEERWSNRESQLKECEGFTSFSMLRRDGQAKGKP
jgi:heme-degrading monooxygenase HmoA